MTSANVLKRQSSTMGKRKRTEKSKYKHESTGDHCTCAAYVAEMMCKKKAEIKNQGSLPFKFWNTEPWKHTFKYQMTLANKILKDNRISEQALVRAVKSAEFDRLNIFSLKHPKAIGIIKRYQLTIDEESNSKQEIKTTKNPKHRTKKFGNKGNIFKRLKDIEDGKEEEDY